jgi:hypothetical protein
LAAFRKDLLIEARLFEKSSRNCMISSKGQCGNLLMAQSLNIFQQHPRFLQVFRVKPFGEPAIDLAQQLTGFVLSALFPPQPRQSQCGRQLAGLAL